MLFSLPGSSLSIARNVLLDHISLVQLRCSLLPLLAPISTCLLMLSHLLVDVIYCAYLLSLQLQLSGSDRKKKLFSAVSTWRTLWRGQWHVTHFTKNSCFFGCSGVDWGVRIANRVAMFCSSYELMNPSLFLSLSPCPRFLDDLSDALPLRIVLVSALDSLNSSRWFLLAWPIFRLCIAVSSRSTLPDWAACCQFASACMGLDWLSCSPHSQPWLFCHGVHYTRSCLMPHLYFICTNW